MDKTILIVDDDSSVRKLLKAALEKNGYGTLLFSSGEDALEGLDSYRIDGIILDIILPGIDGFEVLKKIRGHKTHSKIPVVMLTSKDSEVDTVLGLELGADDYLSKPVRYHELLVRIKRILSKAELSSKAGESFIEVSNIKIDLSSRTVYFNRQQASLSYLEFELLVLFAKSPNRVFKRDYLLDLLWPDCLDAETRTVDVHIRRLRSKLEEHGINPRTIESVRSVGYRLSPENGCIK